MSTLSIWKHVWMCLECIAYRKQDYQPVMKKKKRERIMLWVEQQRGIDKHPSIGCWYVNLALYDAIIYTSYPLAFLTSILKPDGLFSGPALNTDPLASTLEPPAMILVKRAKKSLRNSHQGHSTTALELCRYSVALQIYLHRRMLKKCSDCEWVSSPQVQYSQNPGWSSK